MESRRIAIIDDHPLLACALRNQLEDSGQLEPLGLTVEQLDPTIGASRLLKTVTAEGGTTSGVSDSGGTDPSTGPVACAVVDLGLPFPGGGSAMISPLVEEGIRVVVLTGETERRQLAKSSAAGAEAVLSKSEPLAEIVETILQVAGGQPVRATQRAELDMELQRLLIEEGQREAPFAELSPREREVLAGLMDGQAPATLAEQNYVSVETVRTQIKSVLSKLGVSSQLQAVALAHRSQWKPPDD